MDLSLLDKILIAEPKYRRAQARRAVFHEFISSWEEATNFSKDWRLKLAAEFPLEIAAKISATADRHAQKALIKLADGNKIETVLMSHSDGRRTVCLSSQVGCPLGCRFCATGSMGFKRNLSYSEIIIQALFWARQLKTKGEKISNIVFMGMGEPFLNYDAVMKAVDILNDPDFFNIGARQISISTVGIIPGIKQLAKEKRQLNLAISLHAASDHKRSKLIPANEKYPLDQILKAVDDYILKTKRRVMFEYILMSGVNDGVEDAKALAQLMQRPLVFVNLIKYNQTGKFRPSSTRQMEEFKKILETGGVVVTCRFRLGDRIAAACGQLAGKEA
ncbi:MAG TPA: 23S rRNA (adenine(2503)-C(2))-methyltransferase RlmN [bacterium]|nr:23S rRNA (adenine(2503)-C(2))-methyltransferase RlmN [bacterium]HPT29648.1 23S rRNA (adenine(2503)-C(2))-methyltransferase RlmN [bacterium]